MTLKLSKISETSRGLPKSYTIAYQLLLLLAHIVTGTSAMKKCGNRPKPDCLPTISTMVITGLGITLFLVLGSNLVEILTIRFARIRETYGAYPGMLSAKQISVWQTWIY